MKAAGHDDEDDENVSTQAEFALEHLLRRMFSVDEMRRFLVRLDGADEVRDHLLDGCVTPMLFTQQAVLTLQACQLIGRPFFEALMSERPAREPEIVAVALLWGLVLPSAPPSISSSWPLRSLAAPPNPATFVGRLAELAQLRDVFLPNPQSQRSKACSISGMAGVGKSDLVARFVEQGVPLLMSGALQVALFPAEQPTTDSLIGRIASTMCAPGLLGASRAELQAALLIRRLLIHIDNVDDHFKATAAYGVVNALPQVPILLSGRYDFSATSSLVRLRLNPLQDTEGLELLEHTLRNDTRLRLGPTERQRLVQELGGLPLAIRVAVSFLNVGYRVDDLLAELREEGLHLEPFAANDPLYADRPERTLAATFGLSLNALRADLGAHSETGMRALQALGAAPISGVGRSLLEAIMGVNSPKVLRWVSAAVRLSLVEHGPGERWRAHKLVGAKLRALMSPQETEEAMTRLDQWYLERLPREISELGQQRWAELNAEQAGLEERLLTVSGSQALRFCLVGYEYAHSTGAYGAWLQAYDKALREELRPQERAKLLSYQSRFAQYAGDLDLATRSCLALLSLATEHQWTAERALGLGRLAELLERKGAYREALRVRREEQLPCLPEKDDSNQRAGCLIHIVDLHFALQELEEAEAVLKDEILPVLVASKDKRDEACGLSRLATLHMKRSEWDRALNIQQQLLSLFKELGDRRSYGIVLGKLAEIHAAKGSPHEALKIRLTEQLPLLKQLGDLRTLALAQGRTAELHFDVREPNIAVALLRESVIPYADEHHDAHILLSAQHLLAKALLALDPESHREEATSLLKAARSAAETLGIQERDAILDSAQLHGLEC